MLASIFRSQYHHMHIMPKSADIVPDIFTSCGDAYKTTYKPVVADDGSLQLVVDAKTNLYAEIQSHRDSVELSALIERYKLGDVTALNRTEGVYADVTQMPKTYREVLQTVIDGENIFASLPPEIREKYGNDFNRWFSAGMELPNMDKTVVEAVKEAKDMTVEKGDVVNE